jgi:hypothetical protein
MGRYYDGDINGKFWFAVQSSDAADRFGVQGYANYIEYCYCEEDLQGVEDEIKRIEDELGDKLQKLNNFFNADKVSYSDDELVAIGIDKYDLSEYADLELGIKIRDCIKENGECYFKADL